MPRFIDISTVSSNFALAFDFTSLIASSADSLARGRRSRRPPSDACFFAMAQPSTTVRPIERAEPASMRTAPSTSLAFMSFIFCSAISRQLRPW